MGTTIQRIRRLTKQYTPLLQKAFKSIDDGQGLLLAELEESINLFHNLELPPPLRRILEPRTLRNVFDIMDDDQDGRVNLEEFTRGLFSLAFCDVPIETTHMLEMLRRQNRDLADIATQARELQASLMRITESLRAHGSGITTDNASAAFSVWCVRSRCADCS